LNTKEYILKNADTTALVEGTQ